MLRLHHAVVVLLLLCSTPAWGEITLGNISEGIEDSDTTTFSVAHPTGLANGQVVVVSVCKDDNPSSTSNHSFVLIDAGSWAGGSQVNGSLWYKVITDAGSETNPWTWTTDSEQGVIFATILIGVDNTTPLDGVTNNEVLGNNDDTPAHGLITPNTDCALIFASICSGENDSSPMGHPSGMTEIHDTGSANVNGASGASAYFVQPTAVETPVYEWTSVSAGATAETVLHLQSFRAATADCSAGGGRTRRMF